MAAGSGRYVVTHPGRPAGCRGRVSSLGSCRAAIAQHLCCCHACLWSFLGPRRLAGLCRRALSRRAAEEPGSARCVPTRNHDICHVSTTACQRRRPARRPAPPPRSPAGRPRAKGQRCWPSQRARSCRQAGRLLLSAAAACRPLLLDRRLWQLLLRLSLPTWLHPASCLLCSVGYDHPRSGVGGGARQAC